MDKVLVYYDIEADALFIHLKDDDIYETIPITPNLNIDLSEDNTLLNVEVLNLSYILKKPVKDFYKFFLNGDGVNFRLEPNDKIPNNTGGDLGWLNKLSKGTYQINE